MKIKRLNRNKLYAYDNKKTTWKYIFRFTRINRIADKIYIRDLVTNGYHGKKPMEFLYENIKERKTRTSHFNLSNKEFILREATEKEEIIFYTIILSE